MDEILRLERPVVTVKIGSSVLLTERQRLDTARIVQVARQVRTLRESGIHVILIMSGAVACGSHVITDVPLEYVRRRAAAGVGQVVLTTTVQRAFAEHRLPIAQLLLTRQAVRGTRAKNELRLLLAGWLAHGVVPIINENDVVDLNSFDGNDFLAAEITHVMQAHRLIMLSTMKGSPFGVGGGDAKMRAITWLKRRGIGTDLVNGKEKDILVKSAMALTHESI